MRELQGRTAVVTGAASGIGRALAGAFAGCGMRVVLADVDAAGLQAAARELSAGGAAALAVPTDVARSRDLELLAERARDAFGDVHVLCNNAGIAGVPGPAWAGSAADWDRVLAVNLRAVVDGVRVFLPRMLASEREGHVLNTASMAGLAPGPGNAAYNVSKCGVVAFSETLHHDLALAGARVGVSVLCPSFVRTRILESLPRRPAGPSARAPDVPDEVRRRVAAGLAPEAVAARVVEAIRAGRFWILTHPESRERVRRRADDLLEGRDPAAPATAPGGPASRGD